MADWNHVGLIKSKLNNKKELNEDMSERLERKDLSSSDMVLVSLSRHYYPLFTNFCLRDCHKFKYYVA